MTADPAELYRQIAELETEVDRLSDLVAEAPQGDPAELGEWVATVLRPMLTEYVGPRKPAPWCDRWENHPLLSHLFGSAHRSWNDIDGPGDEVSWNNQTLLPLLSLLRDPGTSPVLACADGCKAPG